MSYTGLLLLILFFMEYWLAVALNSHGYGYGEQ